MYTKEKWNSEHFYNFKYAQYLPKDFNETKKYPLMIFLHGAGESGDDLDVACRHGYMKYVREENAEYPFICIAPQCPKGKYWGCFTESLIAFLDYIEEKLPVDKSRIYLTGLSMGGTGTWMLSMADSKRFAAIAPICGSGIVWNWGPYLKLPVFMYHGDCDNIVPITESVSMLNSINSHGGKAKLKICHNVGHDAWEIAYKDEELLEWFFSHKKED